MYTLGANYYKLTEETVNGLAHNEYRGMVQSEVVADDLFHE